MMMKKISLGWLLVESSKLQVHRQQSLSVAVLVRRRFDRTQSSRAVRCCGTLAGRPVAVARGDPAGTSNGKIHYTSLPVASPQPVGYKLARAKVRCVCCVVSFPKFYYNDLLPTCCGLVGDMSR